MGTETPHHDPGATAASNGPANSLAPDTLDLDALQAIADQATWRGGWELGYQDRYIVTRQDDVLGEMRASDDARFAVTFDPPTVTRLLALAREHATTHHDADPDVGSEQDAGQVESDLAAVFDAHQPHVRSETSRRGIIRHHRECRACGLDLPWETDQVPVALAAHHAQLATEQHRPSRTAQQPSPAPPHDPVSAAALEAFCRKQLDTLPRARTAAAHGKADLLRDLAAAFDLTLHPAPPR